MRNSIKIIPLILIIVLTACRGEATVDEAAATSTIIPPPIEAPIEASPTPTTTPYSPAQEHELMDVLSKIRGEWVDKRFYESAAINESVVYPLEFVIGNDETAYKENEDSEPPYYFTIAWAQRPNAPITWGGTGGPDGFLNLVMKPLDDGLVELTIDQINNPANEFGIGWNDTERFIDHRIIVDANKTTIDEVVYYIGETTHTMVRFDENRDATRFYAEATESGHIKINYVVGRWGFSGRSENGIKVYRSILPNERGELIHEDGHDNEILFEFIDTTAEAGHVYYYSIWDDSWGSEFALTFGGEWQMVVDVLALPKKTKPWQDAYIDFLSNPNNYANGKQYHSGVWSNPDDVQNYFPEEFMLVDINNNGVPILIIVYGDQMSGSYIFGEVYTFTDQVIELGQIDMYYRGISMSTSPNYPGLFTDGGRSSSFYTDYWYIEDGKLLKEPLWYEGPDWDVSPVDPEMVITEFSDNEELMAEARKAIEFYTYENVLKRYALDESTIKEIIHSWSSNT